MFGRVATLSSRGALVALAVGACAGSARAQPEIPAESATVAAQALRIDWDGRQDCDRGDAVRAKVLRLLGGSQRAPSGGVKVTVTVRRERGPRYVAVLETTTPTGGGRKRLEGESCDAIALASSVVIALSLDPNASLDAEPPVDEPKPRKEPPRPKAKPKLKPEPKLERRDPAPRETVPYLHGGVGVLFELLSMPAAFTGAGVGVRHRRFSLELGGAVYQPRDVMLADDRRVGAELRLFSGELLGCVTAVPFQLGAVELCPGFKLEYLRATASGVSNPDEATVLMAAGVGALRGRLRATGWLSATVDAGVALRPFQPDFVLLGVGKVFGTPMVSPFVRTGLVVEF